MPGTVRLDMVMERGSAFDVFVLADIESVWRLRSSSLVVGSGGRVK